MVVCVNELIDSNRYIVIVIIDIRNILCDTSMLKSIYEVEAIRNGTAIFLRNSFHKTITSRFMAR